MTAHRITFGEWNADLKQDQLARIERLTCDAVELGCDWRGMVGVLIGDAKRACWAGNCHETERLIVALFHTITQEREWHDEHLARWSAQP